MPKLPEIFVDNPASLTECCAHLDHCDAIGLDTEFIGEETYVPDLCLVQIATRERRILIDPLSAGPLDAFWERIADPKRTIVVHAGREEIRLCHFASNRLPGNIFDVQIAAGLLGLGYPLGYAPLIQEVLGARLVKRETLTNWRARPLSQAQIRYAFDDVRYLLPLWESLSQRLGALDRIAWLAEETETLKHRAVVDNPAVEKWRKLRGIGSLERKRLAIVREIFAWREEKAARVNRPARTVLRDDLIVEIARCNPKREEDLQALRGVGKSDCRGILDAVKQACSLPVDEWPEAVERDIDPPQVTMIASLLGAVLADQCAREDLTASLVSTSQDIKLLVRACLKREEPPAESHLTHGWRAKHVLPGLLQILEGKRGIRIAGVNRDAPFDYFDAPPG